MLEVMMLDDGAPRGTLLFDADRISRFTALEPRAISIHRRRQPDRAAVEAYLEARYAKAFAGRISHHYPSLMSLQDRDGQIHAAVGFRFAGRSPLFLENYLDRPIEAILSEGQAETVSRDAIAEIGSLASGSPGASLFLFLALATHLHHQGCTHAAATATRRLRRGFARVGFLTQRLARADPARIPHDGADWGTYYANDPEVLAGPIAPALPVLSQLLLVEPRQRCEALKPRHTTFEAQVAP